MAIDYRPAEKIDSGKIAGLIHMASDGVVEFLFHDLVADMTAVQIVAYNLETSTGPHSYKSAMVAVNGPDVVGMALSYPSFYHKVTDEMRAFFPRNRLDHLNDYYAVEIPDSWFLDALGVDPEHRRRGIGTRLVELTLQEAKNNDYKILSLIAFKNNTVALALYEEIGFQVAAEIKLAPNAFISHTEGCLLLTCRF